MRIAIYARKSEEREDRQVQSLDDQIRELTNLARREQHSVVAVFQESRSAMDPFNRPEFDRMMVGIEQGEFDGIYVWSCNRLARNDLEGGKISHYLRRNRIGFIRAIDRTFLPSDNALILSVEMGMSVAYVQKLQLDVSRGMRGKVERGWHTCKAPVGYRNDPESREIVIDPVRFPLVRFGWELLLDGKHTLAEIHRILVAKGLTVRSRKRSKPISYARLYTLFKEPFYFGKIVYDGKQYPGKHQPMVTSEEFETVQSRMTAKLIDRRPIKRTFPFSGFIRCGVCGCAVVAEHREKHYSKTGGHATYTYYHCSGWKGCPKKSITEKYAVELFQSTIESIAIPESTVGWLKSALAEACEGNLVVTASSQAALEADIKSLEERIERLTDLRLDGEIDAESFKTRKIELQERLSKLKGHKAQSEDMEQRMLRLAYEKLDRAVEAEELSGEDHDSYALGKLIQMIGHATLTLGKLNIDLHPLLREIATFKPLRNGSERPQRGNVLPSNSVWWTLLNDIRKIVQTECVHQFEGFHVDS